MILLLNKMGLEIYKILASRVDGICGGPEGDLFIPYATFTSNSGKEILRCEYHNGVGGCEVLDEGVRVCHRYTLLNEKI